ncbi:MAG TPA: molybdopterin cofactor-binding domain-containing protein [Ktedonobacteraceae bacterium]|nr:molybdopterin cofactor-binding domain-containing protein [Ktedonobacteraceae bacterium]
MELELRINGVVESLDGAANESLLTMLRRRGYCSVKQGCETGECGACTVLVDGVARPSCVMLAGQAGGCTLTTIEGLSPTQSLHPLQQAFVEVGAVQCGFCTPGMILSAYALLKRNSRPTENEVRDALSGNLCRCTGYVKPIQAVLRAAALLRGEEVTAQEQSAGRSGSGTTGKMRAVTANTSASTLATLQSAIPLQVVGKNLPHNAAVSLVTGKATFADDIAPRGMLYGRILSSPHAHAIIRNIDVSQARALPGIHAVLTYIDVPRIAYSSVERSSSEDGPYDQYCLDYMVRYVGDRVAVVAAETPEIAEQALRLIEVEYNVLPPLLDPRQALEPTSPLVHPESESHGIYDVSRNVAARVHSEIGDVERGFAEADVVVEGEYVVSQTQPVPIESHTVVTYFDEDEYLVVRTSTQVPHHVRRTLASVLNLPARRIRVVKPAVGGSFAGKQELVLEDLCALLTLATHRPVQLAFSRAEEFRASRVNHEHILRLKTGVKRDGTILANQMILLTSTGAYGTHPLTQQKNATEEALSLYPCASRFVAEILYTHLPPSAALRGYGAFQQFFALESHMDEIARQLGIDAVELRRKNWLAATEGQCDHSVEQHGLLQCLQIVEEKLSWKKGSNKDRQGKEDGAATPKDRFRRGIGIALSLHSAASARNETSGAIIKLNEDGSFDVFAGANSSGVGSDTLLAQIAAEVLGVPVEDILMHSSDTSTTPSDTGGSASATLYSTGGAVKRAAELLHRQILAVAGRMLNVLPEVLKVNNGTIKAPDGQMVTIAQVAAHALYDESRHLMATASWKNQQVPVSFAAQGVEVEVDTETGYVRVLNAITAVDVGRALNPMIVEAQLQASITQALGLGLCEEMLYDQNGVLHTDDLRNYHIHSAVDMPEIETSLVETQDVSPIFGAKAVAEMPLNGLAAALANAVASAVGVRIRQIPLTPERVLRAIHAQAARK